jgi:dipicolinate synthase subunit A
MPNTVFLGDCKSPALQYAGAFLRQHGWRIALTPDDTVTHLLLPAPCHLSRTNLQDLLAKLPRNIVIICGNPDSAIFAGYTVRDLLQDETYLAENAAITAHCAIQLMAASLPAVLCRQKILILGWGRIAKCLAQLLHAAGNQVTIAARKEKDRAMAASLMHNVIDLSSAENHWADFRIICNTIPVPVLSRKQLAACLDDCLLMDLASIKGMDSDKVIHAKGLPGKLAPESAGILIGKTCLRLTSSKEDTP